ncbi:hypothetical protein BJV74DRAFT_889931 [Russula compacta]|nr:hypothetical protein BJV74DRAFT_889931 [Russula compacta]
MPPPNHPNPELHKVLYDAAKNRRLNPEFIKKVLRLQKDITVCDTATAYINWSTTLTLLDRKSAQVWFAGVSRPEDGQLWFNTSPDFIRDTHSNGIYYWWYDENEIVENTQAVYWFWIEKWNDIVFIDVFLENQIVAVFVGDEIPNELEFWGNGLWSAVYPNGPYSKAARSA